MGSITLIQGPMFSGKTTTLIRYAIRAEIAKKRTVMIKYSGDTRYSDSKVISHDKIEYRAMTLSSLQGNVQLSDKYDVILIDEGQFFENLSKIVRFWAKRGTSVYISALNADYSGNPWNEIINIGPIETIINLSAICSNCGNDAYFTQLIYYPIDQSNIIIGGNDKYKAVCRKCFKY